MVSQLIEVTAEKCGLVKAFHAQGSKQTKGLSRSSTKNKPWFDNTCNNLGKNYLQAKNRHRANKSMVNFSNLRHSSKIYKKEISKKVKSFNADIVTFI